jgi:F-type H+-transporting ATPase subunit b
MRNLLGGLALMFALGAGLQLCERPVQAEAAKTAATAKTADSPMSEQEVDENDAYLHSPSVIWVGKKLGIGTARASVLSVILNFVLLALGLIWVVLKGIPKAFPEMVRRNRNASIQKNLVDARTATEEAQSRLASVEARLGRLDGEIASMRAQAEKDAASEEVRMKAAVEEERKRILASAEQEIAAATMHAQKQLQHHAAELAIEQAARRLVVSAETDRLLVQGFAQRLTGEDAKKGQN